MAIVYRPFPKSSFGNFKYIRKAVWRRFGSCFFHLAIAKRHRSYLSGQQTLYLFIPPSYRAALSFLLLSFKHAYNPFLWAPNTAFSSFAKEHSHHVLWLANSPFCLSFSWPLSSLPLCCWRGLCFSHPSLPSWQHQSISV